MPLFLPTNNTTMGSILENIECPRCGTDNCFSDYFYETDEEHVYCTACGYSAKDMWKCDDSGNFELIDPNLEANFDNMIRDEYKEEAPYCAYTIKYNNVDISERGTLSAKCDYDVFVETIKTMKNVESVTTSRFEDNTIKREKII